MPAKRVSMRRIREILRLKHACGATDRAIARSMGSHGSSAPRSASRPGCRAGSWEHNAGASPELTRGSITS